MPAFKVVGHHKKLSKEEVRAIVQASVTVLEFHGKMLPPGPNYGPFEVRLLPIGEMGKTKKGGDAAGSASGDEGYVEVCNSYDLDSFLTVVLHELIHATMDPDSEKATSTLTARLKDSVAGVYAVLICGLYQRAAYIAHTKMAYRPKGEDDYNDEQYRKVKPSEEGKKYRRK